MEKVRKIKRFIISLVLALSVFTSFCFIDTYAANVYNTYLDKPNLTDGSGYIVLLLQNKSSGARHLQTFQWFTSKSTNYTQQNNPTSVDITLNDNKIIFYVSSEEGVTRSSIIHWKSSSLSVYNLQTESSNNSVATKEVSFSSYNIVGFYIEGSLGQVYNHLTTSEPFGIN